jgi:hypothetical protein
MAWDASEDDNVDLINSCWTTSLGEDEQRLKRHSVSSTEQTMLQFRIRMKRAYEEYQTLLLNQGF